MSMWAGTCQLVKQEPKRDGRGVTSAVQTRRTVPCNVFEISDASYYAASAAGIRPQAVLEIRRCAYDGEQLVEFDGALLAVERVKKTPDNVRLTLVERVGNREQGS